uniref:C-type lectin domain-containing protein n=1 Tax=Panagrolaimus davidi TaxID=227884 RepID=A0A914QJ87_9BILA
MTWDAAEAFCVDQGGHLVSIHLPEENNFIINNFNIQFGGAWIGLQLNSDVWKWTDGTEFDCDYWDKDEYPNAKKNKAKIVKTKWWQKDSPITKMYFFCKKPAIP